MRNSNYTFEKVKYKGKPHSITKFHSGEFSGKTFVKSINPYDDSEYHWAVTKDGLNWSIYINSPGKLVKTISANEINDVIELLIELNQDIKSHINHS